MPDTQVANARIEKAEANAAQYSQKVAALECWPTVCAQKPCN
jgi:hypothetical protein